MYRSQSLELSLTPPKTPPLSGSERFVRNWLEPETALEKTFEFKRLTIQNVDMTEVVEGGRFNVPHQQVLLLHAPRQKYAHTREQPIPKVQNDREMLVAVEVVGLNPVDWKAPCVLTTMYRYFAHSVSEILDSVYHLYHALLGGILRGGL